MSIVEDDMTQIAEHRAGAACATELRVGIGRRSMRRLRAAFAVDMHGGMARIIGRRPRRLRTREALEARPRVQLRAVDRDVLVGQQPGGPGLCDHRIEERPGDRKAVSPQNGSGFISTGEYPFTRITITLNMPTTSARKATRIHPLR